jgi:hypothetical protein
MLRILENGFVIQIFQRLSRLAPNILIQSARLVRIDEEEEGLCRNATTLVSIRAAYKI